MNKRYICVVDLEATCTNKDEFPKHEMEIIEIGATVVDLVDPTADSCVGHFQAFVKPKINPILTDFCTELTGITQSNVVNGLTLGEAFLKMNKWLAPVKKSLVWGSWGKYDHNQFLKDTKRTGAKNYPFEGVQHVNLSEEFRRVQHCSRKKGLVRALRMANIELTGNHHRALDDAINTAKLIPYIYPKRCWKR